MITAILTVAVVLFCLAAASIIVIGIFRESDERAAEEAAIVTAEEEPVDPWEGFGIARRNYRSSLESWMNDQELEEASLRS